MLKTIPIRYRDFYDIPRTFVTMFEKNQFMFECPFDDDLDDYADEYKVYLLPQLSQQELDGDWSEPHLRAIQSLGDVPAAHVRFDASLRSEIESGVLVNLRESNHKQIENARSQLRN